MTVELSKTSFRVPGLKQQKPSLALAKRRCIGQIAGMPIIDNWLVALGLENGALQARLQEA